MKYIILKTRKDARCDRCQQETEDLFHPVNEQGEEITPDKEYCESCALDIEGEEYEKDHPNPFKNMTEKEAIEAFTHVLRGDPMRSRKRKKDSQKVWRILGHWSGSQWTKSQKPITLVKVEVSLYDKIDDIRKNFELDSNWFIAEDLYKFEVSVSETVKDITYPFYNLTDVLKFENKSVQQILDEIKLTDPFKNICPACKNHYSKKFMIGEMAEPRYPFCIHKIDEYVFYEMEMEFYPTLQDYLKNEKI